MGCTVCEPRLPHFSAAGILLLEQRRPGAHKAPRPTGRKPGRDGAAQRKAAWARALRCARLRHLTRPSPPLPWWHRAAPQVAGVLAATAASESAPPPQPELCRGRRPFPGPRSPRAGRRGGLDGTDAQAVGGVLQGLQLLLVRLMVALHGAAGRAGGWRTRRHRSKVVAPAKTGSGRGPVPRGGALRLPGPPVEAGRPHHPRPPRG